MTEPESTVSSDTLPSDEWEEEEEEEEIEVEMEVEVEEEETEVEMEVEEETGEEETGDETGKEDVSDGYRVATSRSTGDNDRNNDGSERTFSFIRHSLS